mmetsp:Transcript_47233/g.64303  ORF Transcript_47233/g.64303 Transcript_47233/m.64303 type:complete len:96 (-) Transcript_47233:57-344(-)
MQLKQRTSLGTLLFHAKEMLTLPREHTNSSPTRPVLTKDATFDLMALNRFMKKRMQSSACCLNFPLVCLPKEKKMIRDFLGMVTVGRRNNRRTSP